MQRRAGLQKFLHVSLKDELIWLLRVSNLYNDGDGLHDNETELDDGP